MRFAERDIKQDFIAPGKLIQTCCSSLLPFLSQSSITPFIDFDKSFLQKLRRHRYVSLILFQIDHLPFTFTLVSRLQPSVSALP